MSKWKKQPLDERQEREMYSVYKWGFLVLFWGIFAQSLIFNIVEAGGAFVSLSSYIIMITGGAVVTIGSAKRGIWSEYFKPSVKTNLVSSFIAGVIVFLIGLLIPHTRGDTGELSSFDMTIIAGVIAVITAMVTFILLSVLMRATKKRATKLEAEYED